MILCLCNLHVALFPGSPGTRIHVCIHEESLVSFLCKHDGIEIGLKQKGNVSCVFKPTIRSMLGVYDVQL